MSSGIFPPAALALLLAAVGAFSPARAQEALRSPEAAGHLPGALKEVSGLAVSRRDPRLFWALEDSGAGPVLHALEADGRPRGRMRVAGLKNVDWEDLASFTLDGRSWLLIADTGDNRAVRGDCALYVVEEPEFPAVTFSAAPGAAAERVVEVAWKIPVVYPDGPLDCEAVAVDASGERVYLLAKRTVPHGLYALHLRPTPSGKPTPPMERVGEMAAFPPAPEAERMLPTSRGMFRPQPTGLDFSGDGSAAVVVTYGEVRMYPRSKDETWAAALAKAPSRAADHGLRQAEAVAFGADEREILVTSEGGQAPLLRYRIP